MKTQVHPIVALLIDGRRIAVLRGAMTRRLLGGREFSWDVFVEADCMPPVDEASPVVAVECSDGVAYEGKVRVAAEFPARRGRVLVLEGVGQTSVREPEAVTA